MDTVEFEELMQKLRRTTKDMRIACNQIGERNARIERAKALTGRDGNKYTPGDLHYDLADVYRSEREEVASDA